MSTITFEVLADGMLEPCRALCNELMAFQQSKAVIAPERFDGMNFDTRMVVSYQNARDRFVAVAKDGETPIGYVYATVEKVENKSVAGLEDFPEDWQGFYPAWDNLPEYCGCLNNLYLRDAYKGKGIGARLTHMAMDWLRSVSGLTLAFVYISNGNEEVMEFYGRYGFKHSHEVFGGFIHALYCWLRES